MLTSRLPRGRARHEGLAPAEHALTPTPLRVLIIEDSVDDAKLLVGELQRGGYGPVSERVESAEAMQTALAQQTWDLVVSDDSLPQFDSSAALALLKASGTDIPFIIVSGTIGEERAVQAMKSGASDYLIKVKLARLIPVVGRELAEAQQRRARRAAEQAFREREQQSVLELAAAYEATLEGWARALDLRDRETEGHSRRVTDLTVRLARVGVSEAECVHIRRGALLHDIGKMGIPDSILLKPSPLSAEEWDIMRRHPAYARDLLAPIQHLRPALDIPYGHHEKWDGTGYPRGLKGEDIPLAARMFAAVDIWDAVRSDRPYRPAWPDQRAREYLASLAGGHLDPRVTEAFLDLLAALDGTSQSGGGGAAAIGEGRMSGRILVVDDCHTNLELIERWLTGAGCDVLTADSGESALAAVALHHPDLVLLDIEIPEPDGFTVCRRLKHDPATSRIPIIIMSGLEPSATEMSARHLGADDYLAKPVDAYALRARIHRVLERVPVGQGLTPAASR